MENKLRNYFIEKKLTLSIAESCTGGLICSLITDTEGSSHFFNQGFVTYSENAKMNILGVKQETLTNYGVTSKETAQEMAKGLVLKNFGEVGLSTTGILGPTGGSEKTPIGTVFIGFARKVHNESIECHSIEYRSKYTNRLEIKQDIAQKALFYLHKFLNLNPD
ncbi:nicotinamide-nucleotide amidase [Candidatus Gastranaerophilus sp. (ex Termes propinquus)]|nr:nicotinamide-nucleotide amidase [Candidatus Gastranaerophilus sp. (ex Termes propinquus)]